MNNEDIVKYCITSPENVNPAVLRSMLSSIGGGGGSSGLVVNITDEEGTHDLVCDKTWQEMWDAVAAGSYIIMHFLYSEYQDFNECYMPWLSIEISESDYYLYSGIGQDILAFSTKDPNGYPRKTSQQ